MLAGNVTPGPPCDETDSETLCGEVGLSGGVALVALVGDANGGGDGEPALASNAAGVVAHVDDDKVAASSEVDAALVEVIQCGMSSKIEAVLASVHAEGVEAEGVAAEIGAVVAVVGDAKGDASSNVGEAASSAQAQVVVEEIGAGAALADAAECGASSKMGEEPASAQANVAAEKVGAGAALVGDAEDDASSKTGEELASVHAEGVEAEGVAVKIGAVVAVVGDAKGDASSNVGEAASSAQAKVVAEEVGAAAALAEDAKCDASSKLGDEPTSAQTKAVAEEVCAGAALVQNHGSSSSATGAEPALVHGVDDVNAQADTGPTSVHGVEKGDAMPSAWASSASEPPSKMFKSNMEDPNNANLWPSLFGEAEPPGLSEEPALAAGGVTSSKAKRKVIADASSPAPSKRATTQDNIKAFFAHPDKKAEIAGQAQKAAAGSAAAAKADAKPKAGGRGRGKKAGVE
jgi:hypothetical protein